MMNSCLCLASGTCLNLHSFLNQNIHAGSLRHRDPFELTAFAAATLAVPGCAASQASKPGVRFKLLKDVEKTGAKPLQDQVLFSWCFPSAPQWMRGGIFIMVFPPVNGD